MNILSPIFALVANLGFLWRLIGLAAACVFLNEGCNDLSFLSSYKTRKSFTIEELTAMKPGDLPRYLTVANAVPTGAGVIQTTTRRRGGKTQTYIYPVLSLNQVASMDGDSTQSAAANTPVGKVVLKKGFSGAEENAGAKLEETIKGVEGMYEADGLADDVRSLLEEDGYKIDPNPIVISESHSFPSASGAYTQIGVCLLILLLALGSFWWQFIGSRQADQA